jgi:hypothetical protein
MTIAVLCDVTPYGLVELYHRCKISYFRAYGYLYQNTRRRIQEDGTLQIVFFFAEIQRKVKYSYVVSGYAGHMDDEKYF